MIGSRVNPKLSVKRFGLHSDLPPRFVVRRDHQNHNDPADEQNQNPGDPHLLALRSCWLSASREGSAVARRFVKRPPPHLRQDCRFAQTGAAAHLPTVCRWIAEHGGSSAFCASMTTRLLPESLILEVDVPLFRGYVDPILLHFAPQIASWCGTTGSVQSVFGFLSVVGIL